MSDWPRTPGEWVDRMLPSGTKLTAPERESLVRTIFDHLNVVEQLAWLSIYGDPPPPNVFGKIGKDWVGR